MTNHEIVISLEGGPLDGRSTKIADGLNVAFRTWPKNHDEARSWCAYVRTDRTDENGDSVFEFTEEAQGDLL